MGRVFAALVLAVAGVGGCAQQEQWSVRPVPEAGLAGDLAAERLRVRTDVAVGNLANLSTYGYQPLAVLGFDDANTPLIETRFGQGTPVHTQRPLDVLISGKGFFRLSDDGTPGGIVYTRLGQFTRDAEGELVLATRPELHLEPRIAIPADATSVVVDPRGVVSVATVGVDGLMEVGVIELCVFVNPGALYRAGAQLYLETARSGPPVVVECGSTTTLVQNFVEGSAVDPRREQLELQRIRAEMPLWPSSPVAAAR